jgi:hypothetical protein
MISLHVFDDAERELELGQRAAGIALVIEHLQRRELLRGHFDRQRQAPVHVLLP